jgi:N-acetylglucosamine-6-sulfatase
MLRAALLASAVLLASPALAAPPNIIVIMTDDQDDDSLAHMPQVSARLAKGTRFTNSFVNFPLCSPSRATFLSGQTANNHGVFGEGPPAAGWNPFLRKGTLPMWLREAGYTTGLVGVKSLNRYSDAPDTLGFDHWAVLADRKDDSRYYDPTLDVNGVVTERLGEYSTDVFRAEARNFVRAASKPHFLLVALAAPHSPAIPAARHVGGCAGLALPRPPSFNETDVSDKPSFVADLRPFSAAQESKHEKRFREKCETLLSVDELAAELIDHAGNKNCVFYMSDNGFLQGQHRIAGKLYAYEESIRTPLVMWGCGAPAGKQIDAMVYNPDWTATVVALSRSTPSRNQDGKSLLPLLEGRQPWRTALPIRAAGGGVDSDCVRTAEWMYCAHSNGERELYALDRDPYQLTNKASAPDWRDEVRALHALTARLSGCRGERCWFDGDPLQPPPDD